MKAVELLVQCLRNENLRLTERLGQLVWPV